MPHTIANGIKLYYESEGTGEPVILIGGLGSNISSWAVQMPLYSKYFRVICFDNRGMGRSEKPDIKYTIEMMADDTISLLDNIGIDKASFVGKSMGGMITQWVGMKYPDRVNKLVMACCSASRDEVGNEIIKTGRNIALKAGMKAVWLTALFLSYSREYIETNITAIKDNLAKVPENAENLTGYLRQSVACEEHDVVDIVSKIKAKTLVIYGKNDFITSPKRSEELAGLIQNSISVGYDAGHGFWREKQSEVDQYIVNFLLGRTVN
jgi:3-oxoadipate enol-lactonase